MENQNNETEKVAISSYEELAELVKGGHFFHFCVAFALNKGFTDVMKERKEVNFSIGDYDVKLDWDQTCFILSNKIYFARIIHAYMQEVIFIGDNEEEVINELLTELEKTK